MREYFYEGKRIFLTENKKKESCCYDCFFCDSDCNIIDVTVKQPGKIFKLSAATICFSRGTVYFTKA